MKAETVVSWLIHSDWFLLVSWIVLLAAGFGLTFVKSPVRANQPERREIPPAS